MIGVGSSLVSLNLVAQSGGTGQAFLVDTGADVGKLFGDALEQIRGAAAACDFVIPAEGAQGKAVDPSQVNVRYTPTGTSDATLVPQTFMGDPANCGSEGEDAPEPAVPTTVEPFVFNGSFVLPFQLEHVQPFIVQPNFVQPPFVQAGVSSPSTCANCQVLAAEVVRLQHELAAAQQQLAA